MSELGWVDTACLYSPELVLQVVILRACVTKRVGSDNRKPGAKKMRQYVLLRVHKSFTMKPDTANGPIELKILFSFSTDAKDPIRDTQT